VPGLRRDNSALRLVLQVLELRSHYRL
jgi:hypothetical protein